MCEDFNKLVEQYMMFDKKTLAELLAMKELAGRLDVPVVPTYPPTPQPIYPPYPWYPGIGDFPPYWPQVWYTTKTTNGGEYENFTPMSKCDCRHDVVEDTISYGDVRAASVNHIRTDKEEEEWRDRLKNMN